MVTINQASLVCYIFNFTAQKFEKKSQSNFSQIAL